MKRLIFSCLIITTLFGQKSDERKPNKQDMAWACRLENKSHHCECPAMVAEVRDDIVEKCATLYGGPGSKEYVKCLSQTPSECEIVQKPDTKHPEHTCSRNCTMAVCRCHDGPPCVGPTLVHENYGSSDEEQQP